MEGVPEIALNWVLSAATRRVRACLHACASDCLDKEPLASATLIVMVSLEVRRFVFSARRRFFFSFFLFFFPC